MGFGDYGATEDGAIRCYKNCGIEDVRPGKSQCWCDSPEGAEMHWRYTIIDDLIDACLTKLHTHDFTLCRSCEDAVTIAKSDFITVPNEHLVRNVREFRDI